MKRTISALAFLSSLVACLVFIGGGLFLLAVENSGERGAGAMLALFGAVAFAAAWLLVFGRDEIFERPGRPIGLAAGAILAALPVAALAFGALRFAGIPLGSPVPRLDWSVFVVGIALALGAASILLLGYLRSARPVAPRADWPPHPLRRDRKPSPDAETARMRPDADDIRVTPV